MNEVIFTDILTSETFKFTGYNYQCYDLQNYSEEFNAWCSGRILSSCITEI